MRISDWSSDVCSSDLYRFKDAAWEENFLFDYIKQSYLVTSRWLQSTVHDMDGDMDEKTKRKVEFYTRQFVDAMAPSNFAMTNPAVLRATVESRGENLVKGLSNLLRDLEAGKGQLKISQTDSDRSEEHKSELQSLMRISYAVFCLKKKTDSNVNKEREHS